jgi:hypothetical protein
MNGRIELGVYRRLDNRVEGLSDDSTRAVELHNRRKHALHDIFDQEAQLQIIDWGLTDDETSHEFVTILMSALGSVAFTYVVVPGLKFVAEKLAEKAIDESATAIVKWLIAKLVREQKAKSISNFLIKLPDGTCIEVEPPDRNATIRIQFHDGYVSSVEYSK